MLKKKRNRSSATRISIVIPAVAVVQTVCVFSRQSGERAHDEFGRSRRYYYVELVVWKGGGGGLINYRKSINASETLDKRRVQRTRRLMRSSLPRASALNQIDRLRFITRARVVVVIRDNRTRSRPIGIADGWRCTTCV